MKRPLALYFVAAWCFIAMLLATGAIRDLIASSFVSDEQSRKAFQSQLGGALGILVIWHVFLLTQLRPFNRWLSVAFFCYWTATMTWNAFILLPHANNPLRAALPFILFGILNVTCIWYLTRRIFRDFARSFVLEREREKRLRNMERKANTDS